MNWYVIYTKSRSEKSVAEKLSQRHIEVFCPTLKIRKQWSDRWKWVEEPLFRSYCFVRLDKRDMDVVLNIAGVVRYVYFCGKPAIIRVHEIELLKDWLKNYDHGSMITSSFQNNDKVRFRSGPFYDKEAAVVDTRNSTITLYLEQLGLLVKVDLRKNSIEKIQS